TTTSRRPTSSKTERGPGRNKKGAAVGRPWKSRGSLRAGFHAPARGFHATTLHPELRLVRIEPQQKATDHDRDHEGHDVESRQRNLVDDLVDDLDDRVKDQRADPAHVSFRVETGDDHTGSKRDPGHGSGHADVLVKREKAPADEPVCGSKYEQNAHEPHQKLQRQGIPLSHELPSSSRPHQGSDSLKQAVFAVHLYRECTRLATQIGT